MRLFGVRRHPRLSVIARLLRCRFWKSEPWRGPPGLLGQGVDLDYIGAPIRELPHAGRPGTNAGEIGHGKAEQALGGIQTLRCGHHRGGSHGRHKCKEPCHRLDGADRITEGAAWGNICQAAGLDPAVIAANCPFCPAPTGGHWRLPPARPIPGRLNYRHRSAGLVARSRCQRDFSLDRRACARQK